MLEFLVGTGLAAAAGLNAWMPLLVLGLADRFLPAVELPASWAWLSSDIALWIIGAMLVVEIIADKEIGILRFLRVLRLYKLIRHLRVAKVLGVLLFTTVVLVVTVPLMLVFLGVSVPSEGIGLFILALVLGMFGFTTVGTLVAGMLSSSRLRDVLLPVVVYPLVIPVVIGGVELTHVALGGGLPGEEVMWIKLMVGFDMLFAVIPVWLFPRVMVD